MELRQLTHAFRRWWWLALAAVIVAAIASYFATSATPKTYLSRTTLFVGSIQSEANPNLVAFDAARTLTQVYADLATREPVLQKTLDALKLTDWRWEWLRDRVTTRTDQGAPVIEISVVDDDPLRAKVFADEIARQVILQGPEGPGIAEREFVQNQIVSLRTKITDAEAEIRRLDDDISTATSRRQIEEIRNRQGALQTQISGWQTTYANLLALNQGSNSIRVLEPAATPTEPIGPRMLQNIVLASLIGLGLALAAIVLFELIDDTIKTTEDARKSLGLPVLGSVARFGSGEYTDRLVTAAPEHARIAEAYRVLRTNLQFSGVGKSLHTVMVTSSKPKEGKSTTAANLAAVIAQSGKRVILVDADLRRPVQHLIYELDNQEGVTTAFLDEGVQMERLLKPVTTGSLSVLTSGPIPHNPAELLDSQRMVEILNELKRKADYVVIDSPPMLSVADATILASRVDGVLLVVDAGFTRRGVAKRTKEALQGIGANVVGVVVNRAAVKSESDYYYDYSYGSDGKEKKRSSKPRAQTATASSSALKPVKLTKPATGDAVTASNGAANGTTTERAK